jgi:aminoglycoside phosphotransferase (APT) family kinase protein
MSTTQTDADVTSLRPLPGRPEDLTPEWMTAALRAGGLDATVSCLTTATIGEGSGVLSTLQRVSLDYGTGSGPRSVVVKLPSGHAGNRAVAVAYHCYEREVRYYLELRDRSPARTPVIHFAAVDGDAEMAIVMEDLGEYECGNQALGCSLAEAEHCMDAIAQLHAAFWNDVDQDEFDFIPYHHPSYFSEGLDDGAHASWDQLRVLYGDAVPDAIEDVKERYLAAIPAMQAWMTTAPRTVVHGDFRLENLFFGKVAAQSPVVLSDWQGILRGRAVHDVAYFVSQSLPSPLRRASERELVARWHAGLEAGGATDYSAEQAWEDYRRAVLYLWTYVVVIAGSLDGSNARGLAWMTESVRRSAAAIDDLGALSLLSEFEP